MDITIQKATVQDYQKVRSFYYEMIDLMKDMQYFPKWEKGIYPTDEYLMESINSEELWVCVSGGKYVAAMVINQKTNAGYESVRWLTEAKQDEVTVIHVLGVHPAFQGKGIAGAMLRKAIELARENHQKVIRLDVLKGNVPAGKLYPKYGFQYVETVRLFYEDTGWTDFKMYEYALQE